MNCLKWFARHRFNDTFLNLLFNTSFIYFSVCNTLPVLQTNVLHSVSNRRTTVKVILTPHLVRSSTFLFGVETLCIDDEEIRKTTKGISCEKSLK